MSWFFAFLHHFGASTLVAALSAELLPTRLELNLPPAALGLSAVVLLAVNLLHVLLPGKGAFYYVHALAFRTVSIPFAALMAKRDRDIRMTADIA